MQTKLCAKCKLEKDVTEFNKHILHKDGLQIYCNACRKVLRKNKCNDIQAYTQSWHIKHPNYRQMWYKTWRKNNLEYAHIRDNKNSKKKLSTIKGKLNNSMGAGMCRALKGNKAGQQWETIVGYNIEELKHNLESKFLPGMTWDNYGTWHIDHIIPKSFFVFEDYKDVEFQYCWFLGNLQPLWAEDNLKKYNKLVTT